MLPRKHIRKQSEVVKQLVKGNKKLKVCKICKSLVKRVSRKGYCPNCSIKIAVSSISQLQLKEGEIYEKWKANLTKGLQKPDRKNEVKSD